MTATQSHASFVRQCQRDAARAAAWQCGYAKAAAAGKTPDECAAAAGKARRACKGQSSTFDADRSDVGRTHAAFVNECAKLEWNVKKGGAVQDVVVAMHPDVYASPAAVKAELEAIPDAALNDAVAGRWVNGRPASEEARAAVGSFTLADLTYEQGRRKVECRKQKVATADATDAQKPAAAPVTAAAPLSSISDDVLAAAVNRTWGVCPESDAVFRAACDGHHIIVLAGEYQRRQDAADVVVATAACSPVERPAPAAAATPAEAPTMTASKPTKTPRPVVREELWQDVRPGTRIMASYGIVTVRSIEPTADGRVLVTPQGQDAWIQHSSQTLSVVVEPAPATPDATPTMTPAPSDVPSFAAAAIFTTGQVAKVCQVAPRTVAKWFDSGKLKGYRVPGTQDRRIPRAALLAFLRDNGMAVPSWLEDAPAEAPAPAPVEPAADVARCEECAGECVRRPGDADEAFADAAGRLVCEPCFDRLCDAAAAAAVDPCIYRQGPTPAEAIHCGECAAETAAPQTAPCEWCQTPVTSTTGRRVCDSCCIRPATSTQTPTMTTAPDGPDDDSGDDEWVCRRCWKLWTPVASGPCCGRCRGEETAPAATTQETPTMIAPSIAPQEPTMTTPTPTATATTAPAVASTPAEPTMSEPYIMADVETGWVAGFDGAGSPVFESRRSLEHHSTTQNEWLTLIVLAAQKAGIDRIDFVRGGATVRTRSAAEMSDELKAILTAATPPAVPTTTAQEGEAAAAADSEAIAPSVVVGAVELSNPRRVAVIDDYPLGGSKRGRCVFAVEDHPTKGTRVSRTTFGKPKFTTYGGPTCVVDGSDGRTYIIGHAAHGFRWIKLQRSDFMDAGLLGPSWQGGSCVRPDKHPELFAALVSMIAHANANAPQEPATSSVEPTMTAPVDEVVTVANCSPVERPIVHDIDRPDVGGVLPKMQAICDAVREALAGTAPHLQVTTDDNIMSSVTIRGSFDPRDQWANGIYHNSRYFIVSITPEGGRRYYDPADGKVTLTMTSKGRGVPGMRKYTATVANVVEKLTQWVHAGPE